MKNQKGFSLVELLVVVIIIAIIAAIAIPNLLASRRAANEASAISSLRTVHSAEATYQATLGQNVDYAVLTDLATNNLIDTVLGGASGTKSGYTFASTVGAAGTSVYCATAVPTTPGTTGVRSFAVSAPGVIYAWADENVGACAAGLLTTTGGTPIQ
jgi:prepilin-type N-terminal cleavage/methylation domain-containing protein